MYRGVGWYRAHFAGDPALGGKQIFLEFEAVSLVADVFLNGVRLGQHRGGYTAFTFDATAAFKLDGDNVLAVKADTTNDPTLVPWMQQSFGVWPRSYDYAVYGGIYRDVWLTATAKTRIEATFNDTPQISAASSMVRVRTEVKNYDTAARMVGLTTQVLDATGAVVSTMSTTQTVAAGQLVTFAQMSSSPVATPHLWSPGDPYLYRVVSTLTVDGKIVDDNESPLGFRWFTLPRNGPFTLNGRPLFIRGINRHQDWIGKGYALTDPEHLHDIGLIADMGFNFVRHAHYPADPAFVKACDEKGLLLWTEIPMTVSISPAPAFLANARAQLTEMIRQNYNHPSVILWGLGNETDFAVGADNPALSEAYTNQVHRELNTLAHTLDGTRSTVLCNLKLPSNRPLVDHFSSQNWAGWYGPLTYVNNFRDTQLVGEFGADVEITRHREPGTATRMDFSQEYAGLLHEYFVAEAHSRQNNMTGYVTFVLTDFASPRVDRQGPPNTIFNTNQKGLYLSDHKTPKDIAFFYKSMQTDPRTKPMVYIVSHTWLNRWTAPAAKDIWAYSNCQQVRLWNGMGTNPLGTRMRTDGEHPAVKTRFLWRAADVQYNVLYAECLMDGRVVATDKITLQNLPPPPE